MSSPKNISLTESTPWYSSGLYFNCTGCGACCTGSGRVWLSEQEIVVMAQGLEMKVDSFVEEHIERIEGRWAIKENPQNGDCHFLKDGKCRVYQVRPRQCRTFPWWPSTLKNQQTWAEAKRVCEGIEADEAPLVSFAEIKQQLREETKGRRRS